MIVNGKDILASTDATFMELANCKQFRRLTCNKQYDNNISPKMFFETYEPIDSK